MEITLRLKKFDLTNPTALDVIAEQFQDAMWSDKDGLATVTLFVDRDDAANYVMDFVRRLESALRGTKVLGVHRDLVGTTDIALRAGVSREGARKWAAVEDFPAPYDAIGTKTMKVWVWAEVVQWLKQTRAIDMEQDLPDLELMTQIENCIMRNPDHTTVQWHQVASHTLAPRVPRFETIQPAVRVSAGGRAQGVGRGTYDFVGAAALTYAH